MTKKTGFTLAEVLITLGIIGVVAAMTIPTLISNTNSSKFRSQFKKTVSTLNQAGLMAQAQYDIDFSSVTTASCSATDNPETTISFCSILNGTLTGYTYLGTTAPKDKSGSSYKWVSVATLGANGPGTNYYMYSLADGSLIGFKTTAANCQLPLGSQLNASSTLLTNCLGFIDVNGATLPNKEVTCNTGTATALKPEEPCVVGNDANHMTDVFPIVFHDATVEPASNAAKYILTTSK